jgi:hypothetical protein
MTATATPPPASTVSPPGWLARRRGASTPQLISLAMLALVIISLVWGAVGGWTANQHAGAASDVVHVNEPLSYEAQQLYHSLSDADVTATTAFLSGTSEALAVRQHYEADIAQAGADLAGLTASAAASGNAVLRASLSTVAMGLPVYTEDVAHAQGAETLGYQLFGGSAMQVASEQMHLTLLPAARAIYDQVNLSLAARSAQATGAPLVVVTLVISICLLLVLIRAQRWLSRRTRRTFNLGLVAATLALTIASVWLLGSFLAARSDFGAAESHGSKPAEALELATIAVQRARGDQVLNLISRSGATSFQGDFAAARKQIGPGSGSLLSAAAAAGPPPAAARAIAAADHDAASWYATGQHVFALDLAANYAAETTLVIGTGSASSAAGFSRLEADLNAAIAADRAVFASDAGAGAGAYGGVEVAIVVAALVMAAGSALGLAQRLGEYR